LEVSRLTTDDGGERGLPIQRGQEIGFMANDGPDNVELAYADAHLDVR
jgi:hypothetical protein